MDYNKIEQGLISSISEDDLHKVSKQLQVKQWAKLYGNKLLRFSLSRTLNFVKQIISDEDCWDEVDSLEGVKLNRYEVGRKLLAVTTPSGEDNPFNNMQKYKVACWCCFEDKIRELWDEAQSKFVREKPIVRQLDSTYAGHGPLVTYWTHYITGYMDKFKAKLKLTGDNNDLHGFESAVRGKQVEGLEYFWNRLQPVLSSEEKDDLLIYTATYSDLFCGSANSDMVDFAMRYLDESKYHQLLRKDYEKNEHYSSVSKLVSDYLFDRAEKLFKYLKQEELTDNEYYVSISWGLRNIALMMPYDSNFINAGYKMLSIIWHMVGFEEHKQLFLQKLSSSYAILSDVAQLVKAGKTSDILSEIVSALNIEQVRNIQKSELWVYEILKEANLFNDDVMKNLVAMESTSVNTLASQEELVVLGVGSSIDSQEIENA